MSEGYEVDVSQSGPRDGMVKLLRTKAMSLEQLPDGDYEVTVQVRRAGE